MNVDFFLGANSGAGFYSLYDEFCCDKGDYLYLIKAGAGGGKSGFMRKVAAAAAERGYDTESVLCSGDPASLDAVYIPKLKIGFMDATAPHAAEPMEFAYNSGYVNLGKFCKRIYDARIEEYTRRYRQMYKVAYAYLAAAANLETADAPELISAEMLEKARLRAKSAVNRELGKRNLSGKTGRVKRRFIRCISCRGELVLNDSIDKLCKQVYCIDDRYGIEQAYLRQVLEQAVSLGFDAIVCPSPLCPDRLDAVLVPERSAAFVRASAADASAAYRSVRLDEIAARGAPKQLRHEHKLMKKHERELLTAAQQWLARAKQYHDELERVYNPHVDFASLNAFADEIIEKLFA